MAGLVSLQASTATDKAKMASPAADANNSTCSESLSGMLEVVFANICIILEYITHRLAVCSRVHAMMQCGFSQVMHCLKCPA